MTNFTHDEIQRAVRRRYAEAAAQMSGKFSYPTGAAGAGFLGYELAALRALPGRIVESFCGVGNPLALGPVRDGESVLDVGCGGGLDLILACKQAGKAGRVFGIDLTPEMAEKARENLALAECKNAHVAVASSEMLPFHDETFDLIISNGVINLSPAKEQSLREMFRVLKPGGRLQFADIVLGQNLPADVTGSLEAWSD